MKMPEEKILIAKAKECFLRLADNDMRKMDLAADEGIRVLDALDFFLKRKESKTLDMTCVKDSSIHWQAVGGRSPERK